MDAECKEKRREWRIRPAKIVERHDRFSMDPQRFDDILAEITTGYGNIRSSFENVNIAEILEEMVTEFARAALETEEAPKFTELAVLLQHCAALYGRKVDYLYRHVLDVCDALQHAAPAGPEPPEQARRRAHPAAAPGFAHVALEAAGGATRAPAPARPPPTLPRMYAELEPRPPAPHEEPLRDEAGEPVGAPADYHVTWRLRDGLFVDELEGARAAARPALRPLSLLELQQALAAAAPPDPPPAPPSPTPLSPSPPSPRPASPAPSVAGEARAPSPSSPPTEAVAALSRRKRRSSARLADIVQSPIKMFKEPGGRQRCEFRVPAEWVARVVAARARDLLLRRHLTARAPTTGFRGFEDAHPEPGGFPGWSRAEALLAAAAASATLRAADLESDDDGFFENSSFSSLDSSRSTPPPAPPAAPPAPPAPAPPPPAGAEEARAADAAWSARVAARAAAEEARGGVDVRALAAALLAALPARGRPLPFPALLRRAARQPRDVSRLLLATLFLANSGNVEVVGDEPPALGAFSVSLVDADERRYAAAADAEAQLLAPPPPPPA